MKYMVIAYLFIWVLLSFYLFSLGSRIKKLEDKMEEAENSCK